MKERTKDTLIDLCKILAIILVIVVFFGMGFIPEIIAKIIIFGFIGSLHIWVIGKIIARYKNMTRSQRKDVLNYFLFLGLGIILVFLAYNGWFDRWVKDENLLFFLVGGFIIFAWNFGLYACKKDEE